LGFSSIKESARQGLDMAQDMVGTTRRCNNHAMAHIPLYSLHLSVIKFVIE